MSTHAPRGPGLQKARPPSPIEERAVRYFRAFAPDVRRRIEEADAVSEGAVRDDDEGPTWFGTTSLVVGLGGVPVELHSTFHTLLTRDLHARARIVRVAHREASFRAPGPLGRLECDVRFEASSGAVRIDVDVQAPLIGGSRNRVRR
jgi:hypothetical protein